MWLLEASMLALVTKKQVKFLFAENLRIPWERFILPGLVDT